MKKLITATAFILFGTMLTVAQTTKKSDKKVRMAEKLKQPKNANRNKPENVIKFVNNNPEKMNRNDQTSILF